MKPADVYSVYTVVDRMQVYKNRYTVSRVRMLGLLRVIASLLRENLQLEAEVQRLKRARIAERLSKAK